jgi:hypothetical protein
MNLQPFTVARYGIYAAATVAVLSVFLGQQAGASFDFLLMRAVPIFVIVAALGFGADAVLSIGGPNALQATPHNPGPADEPTAEGRDA